MLVFRGIFGLSAAARPVPCVAPTPHMVTRRTPAAAGWQTSVTNFGVAAPRRLPVPLSICELARGLELARLPDDHENVACSELELGVRAPDVVRPAADRQHQGPRAGPEPALGEGLADQNRRVGEANATHRHLGEAGDGAEA